MKLLPPTPEGLEIAAAAIHNGQVVAYPTDTVYGLAVNPFSEDAVKRLFGVKRRDAGKPVLVVVADEAQLSSVVDCVSHLAGIYIQAFWPGPLSLLFPRSDRIPLSLTGGTDKICVRCPACPVARAFCRAAGGALTSSSANLSGQTPAGSLKDLHLPGVAFGIDAGQLNPSAVSTVVDPAHATVIRQGAVAKAEIRAVAEW